MEATVAMVVSASKAIALVALAGFRALPFDTKTKLYS